MKRIMFVAAVFLFNLFSIQEVHSQSGATALPFLLIGNSPEGNALGESRISLFSQSPILSSSNPALLGVQGKSLSVNSEFYVEKTQWLPKFDIPDLTLNSFAITAFTPIKNPLSLPISVGLGISQTTLNLGKFVLVDEFGNSINTTGKEYFRTYSFGVGVDYGVRFGVGLNYKELSSKIGSAYLAVQKSGEPRPYAMDYSAFLYAPIYKPAFTSEALWHPVFEYLQPFLNFSSAFVYANNGDKIFYNDEKMKDCLPKTFSLGYTIEAGIAYNYSGMTGNFVALKLIREAEDLLVSASASKIEEQSFPGDMDIMENLIRGRSQDKVTIRKGFEISFLDIISLRSGSNKVPYRDFFKTSGYGIHISKIFVLFNNIAEKPFTNPVIEFITQHCDIIYNQADYSSNRSSALYGTTFSGLTISMK